MLDPEIQMNAGNQRARAFVRLIALRDQKEQSSAVPHHQSMLEWPADCHRRYSAVPHHQPMLGWPADCYNPCIPAMA